MFAKLTSAVTSLSLSSPSTPKPGPSHSDPARISTYITLAEQLQAADVPVSSADDCARCDAPCSDSDDAQPRGAGAWDGQTYDDYVLGRYGELGGLPFEKEVDWDTELAGSSQGGKGRVVVISTGKSDWVRDHTEEPDSLALHLTQHLNSLKLPSPPLDSNTSATSTPPPSFIAPAALPPPTPSSPPSARSISHPPTLYSSSLISQSDDPEDQTVLVLPDWKVVHEVENSREGVKGLWEGVLHSSLGRAGRGLGKAQQEGGLGEEGTGVERRRSWVLPYRAVVLLCSHKRRDKKCHIAAPLLRSALMTVFDQHGITVDADGSSLSHLEGPPLEEVAGSEAEREAEVGRRIEQIEGVRGGDGGEVGVFDINHVGGHKWAGVMLILFPSGAYVSYGRVTPHEIPRVVEDTIINGQIVPGLLRNAVGVQRRKGAEGCKGKGNGFLAW